MSTDNSNNWLEALAELRSAPEWEDWQDLSRGRYLLSRLRRTLLNAPEKLTGNLWQQTTEEFLANESLKYGPDLDRVAKDFWADADDEQSLFRRAAVAARYIDQHIAPGSVPQAPSGTDEFLTKDNTYVFPSPRALAERPPTMRHGIKRRLLLNHRVVPTQIDGRRVLISVHPQLAETEQAKNIPRKIGCCLFLGFRLNQISGRKDFIAESASADGPIASILAEQLETARVDHCDTVVWPELTMEPVNVSVLSGLLATSPIETPLPTIILAGSWHIKTGDTYVNRGIVLDGNGDELVTFDKCLPFLDSKPETSEGIEGSDFIQLMVTEHEVVALTICRDFCDGNRLKLLEECDATYALVPSLGKESTVTASLNTAANLQTSVGTLSAVSQQLLIMPDEEAPRHAGYVIKAPRSPQKLEISSCKETGQFISFKSGA